MKITTKQRYADKANTVLVAGTFNVYVGRTYIGSVYTKGDRWQWGAMMMEDSATFDEAVAAKVRFWNQMKEAVATA